MTVEEELANARQVVATLSSRLEAAQRERATLHSENTLLRLIRNDIARLRQRAEVVAAWLKAGVPINTVRDRALEELARVLREIKESDPKEQPTATQQSKVS